MDRRRIEQLQALDRRTGDEQFELITLLHVVAVEAHEESLRWSRARAEAVAETHALGHTLEEIGEVLGVKRQRVHAMIRQTGQSGPTTDES